MSTWNDIVSNQVLISAAMGWLVAQVLKTLIDIWYNKTFSPDRLWGSGGMPSSHSATVCALATSTALRYGFYGYEFAVSFIFSLVVMYDAMGVRRETGKQAKLLNMILENNIFEDNFEHFEERLKEFVGHTPLQVFMGAILGIIIAFIIGGMY
jgi:acid phosphatase/vanadium-dependent haloperoxidase related protein